VFKKTQVINYQLISVNKNLNISPMIVYEVYLIAGVQN